MSLDETSPPESRIRRVRHETKRRRLTILRRKTLAPNYVRLTLSGADLPGFTSLGFDDHIKLFLTGADGRPVMRDFTPRRYDAATNELDIEFALHETGPASDWARTAQVGSALEIGGPRGSIVIEDSFHWYLLIGDETALPAIARRLEELRRGVPVIAIVEVDAVADEIALRTAADLSLIWVHPSNGASLEESVRALRLPPGEGFVWIAGEATVAKSLRAIIVDELGHPRELVKAAGYWQRGAIGVHQHIGDEEQAGATNRQR